MTGEKKKKEKKVVHAIEPGMTGKGVINECLCSGVHVCAHLGLPRSLCVSLRGLISAISACMLSTHTTRQGRSAASDTWERERKEGRERKRGEEKNSWC